MSIIRTLKKVVDPIRARQEDAERKKQREVRQEQEAGEPPLYRCRVCGHEDTRGTYCPTCLSDTMQPAAASREG